MYGLPGSPIQFGATLPKKKSGRKSAQAQFLEKQNDLFPVDLYTSKLSQGDFGAKSAARAHSGEAARTPGAPGTNTQLKPRGIEAKSLYCLVTRKGSAKSGTNDTKRTNQSD